MMKKALSVSWIRNSFQEGRRRFLSHVVERTEVGNGEQVMPNIPAFDYVPPAYTGPSAAEILRKRREFLSPSMFYFYEKPVCVDSIINLYYHP